MLLLGGSLVWIRGLLDVIIESLLRLFAIDGSRREVILEAWHRGKGGYDTMRCDDGIKTRTNGCVLRRV